MICVVRGWQSFRGARVESCYVNPVTWVGPRETRFDHAFRHRTMWADPRALITFDAPIDMKALSKLLQR